MRTFSFEKLNVWQKCRELTVAIYGITRQFPEEERFGLSNQMRRCAISLGSNIAEGTGRHTNKDKARFTEIAFGSGLELLNQCILSFDLGMINQEQHDSLRGELTEILAMLDGLYKSQLNS